MSLKKKEKIVFVVEGSGLSLRVEAKKRPAGHKLVSGFEFNAYFKAKEAVIRLLTQEIDNYRVVRQGAWAVSAADVLKGNWKARSVREKASRNFLRRIGGAA